MTFTRMSKIDPIYIIVSCELISRILKAVDMMTTEQAGDALKRDVENYKKWNDTPERFRLMNWDYSLMSSRIRKIIMK